MPKTNFTLIIILVSCLLLNSVTVFAAGLTTNNDSEIHHVLNKKEKAILEKFENAKKWIQEREPFIDSFFSDTVSKFKLGMNRMRMGIKQKLKEFQSRHSTPM